LSNIIFEYSDQGMDIESGNVHAGNINIRDSIFRLNNKGLIFEGQYLDESISGCLFINNIDYCLKFQQNATGVNVTNSSFSGNGTAVYVDATSSANLGSGAVGGNNQFVCNGIDVNNLNPTMLSAENNWWGDSPPNAAKILGAVDYTPYLSGPVRDILTDLLAALSGISDIALTWPDLANGCGYRVFRSSLPNQNFVDISGSLSAAQFTDGGAASTPGLLFYKVELD
jgi:hypothetical protein